MNDQSNERTHALTMIVFKDEDHWIAMCLEKYIGSQGRSREEAMDRLKIVYRAELDESIRRTGKAFDGIMASPQEYWKRLENDPSTASGVIYDIGPSDSSILVAA